MGRNSTCWEFKIAGKLSTASRAKESTVRFLYFNSLRNHQVWSQFGFQSRFDVLLLMAYNFIFSPSFFVSSWSFTFISLSSVNPNFHPIKRRQYLWDIYQVSLIFLSQEGSKVSKTEIQISINESNWNAGRL